MAVRFILGVAGSGKTEYCLKSIREKLSNKPGGYPLLYLVPEQATFQLEKELACTPELGGIMRVQVLSFRRLAWRVFREIGGETRKPIGELGKKMVLKKLLDDKKGDLQVFAQAAKQPGFLDMLSKTLSEMKAYLITPEQLRGTAGFFDTDEHRLLSAKLRDISVLYKEFETYLEDKYLDPDDYLTTLAEKVSQCNFIKDAEIWIDDFTGFTPQEYKVLGEIIKNAKQVNVSLCIDPQTLNRSLEDEDCFYITKETYLKIVAICENLKRPIIETLKLPVENVPYRFLTSPDLAYLEKHYYNPRIPSYDQETQHIEIASTVNPRAEVEGIAREILHLSRNKGYRWREIAVIFRDFEGYQELIETTFNHYGVPFFMDKKRPMIHHPLIELVISSMETVFENWSPEPLFRLLKTDFFALDRDAVDRLENYCLAHGIRGKAWLQQTPWSYRRKSTLGEDNELSYWEQCEIAYINETKEMVQDVLLDFYNSLKKAASVADKTAAIYKLLEKLEVDIKLQGWIVEVQEYGDLEEEREHSQIYQAVIQVFEELVEALGDESLSLEEYFRVLKAGLENIELGLIPPGLDQVVIASLGRSRISNIKATFLAGVTDGVLPKRPSEEGMLTDRERETLQKEVNMELAPGDERLLIDEDYLVYTGLTRASEYLYLSYPLADTEGRALMPSMIIDNFKKLFPGITEKLWNLEPKSQSEIPAFICSGKGTLPIMASQFRCLKEGIKIEPVWFQTYNWFINQEEYSQKLGGLLKGLFWENQEKPLFKHTRKKLFATSNLMKTSVSRLEKFKQCPFAHFLNYGLKLKRRLSNRLEAPDYGQFYHGALKDFFEKIDAKKLDLAQVTDTGLRSIVDEVIGNLAPQMQNELLLSSNRYKYLAKKLQDTVEITLKAMIDHAKKGQARPIGHELDFGYENSALPPLEISVGDTVLQISGRIDRVDSVVGDDAKYLLVIDYKSGNVNLKLDEIYYGLSLQLLAYLLVCLENSGELELESALPGGICYFRVHNPIVRMDKTQDPDEVAREISKEYKLRGMILADETFVRLIDNELITGWSQMIPVGLKSDGFYQKSRVFTKEEFQLLKEHFYEKIQETGQEILKGIVSIEPYKKGKLKPCNYCDFKSVCQFDVLFKENNYKVLKSVTSEVVWEKLKNS